MKTIRIFISSPGDVKEERKRAGEVVEKLQKRYAGRLILQTVDWKKMPLTVTGSFQQEIEKHLNSDVGEREAISFQRGVDALLSKSTGVDIAVFILWSRLGSPLGTQIPKPDGSAYRSGTERELDLMLAAYEQSGNTQPQILAYVRDDKDGFIEAQRGEQGYPCL